MRVDFLQDCYNISVNMICRVCDKGQAPTTYRMSVRLKKREQRNVMYWQSYIDFANRRIFGPNKIEKLA